MSESERASLASTHGRIDEVAVDLAQIIDGSIVVPTAPEG